jgi:hypothetical protein
MPETNAVAMFRNNNRDIELTITKKSTGLPFVLTDCTVAMYVKNQADDYDVNALITKDGIISDASGGKVMFFIEPDDTMLTTLKANYHYTLDFELTTSDGKKYTVLRTTFKLIK